MSVGVLGGRLVGLLAVATVAVNIAQFNATNRTPSWYLLLCTAAAMIVTVPLAAFRVWAKDYALIQEQRQALDRSKPHMIARIYQDRVIGTFPFEDDSAGWYTKCLLLVHVKNRGTPSIISELEFYVRDKDGASVHVQVQAEDQSEPSSAEPSVRFRSMGYVAENAITHERAANLYVYCRMPNIDYQRIDRASWEIRFKDAYDQTFIATPTSAMRRDASGNLA